MKKLSSEYIRSIATQALDLDPAQREAFIVSACEQDPGAVHDALKWMRLLQLPAETDSTKTVELGDDHGSAAQSHCFAPGQIIDNRLKIIEFIDEGGMGEVYAALELNLQQKVALKAIRSEIAAHSGNIERFKTEVKQSLRITHPNVCRVHQLASHQDRDDKPIWFLTMELLEGRTLARCVAADGPIPFDRAFALIRQMVSGLACAHHAGIVHRQLKPSNILIESFSTCELQ